MFDFDKLSKLAKDPEAFETERSRIIAEYLETVPEEQRKKVQQYQEEIDKIRAALPPDQFMGELLRRTQENLLNLNEQLKTIQTLTEHAPDSVSQNVEIINRVAYAGRGFKLGKKDDTIA